MTGGSARMTDRGPTGVAPAPFADAIFTVCGFGATNVAEVRI